MHAHLIAVILSLMPHVDAYRYASAIVAAVASEPAAYRPTPELVVAVMYVESRGFSHACKDDRFGGADAGLMQVRVPHARCASLRVHRPDLFDVETNVHLGVHLLSSLMRYERTQHGGGHDVLCHYSGIRSSPCAYAARVHQIERNARP